MSTQRIITQATAMVVEGFSPSDAIDAACDAVATTPSARAMARRIFATATASAAAAIGAWR